MVPLMKDVEIEKYLKEHNFIVDAQDCLIKVFNTSYQIIDSNYDYNTNMMTITTPNKRFTFKWELWKL